MGVYMRILSVVALLFSASAFACPDLTGTFTCTYQDGSSEQVTISQQINNGVTIYNYNGSMIATDNITRAVPDDETVKNATFRAWCDGASLKGNLIGKYYNNGSYFGDLDMTLDLSITGRDLKTETSGNLKDTGGTDYPLGGTTVCTRI